MGDVSSQDERKQAKELIEEGQVEGKDEDRENEKDANEPSEQHHGDQTQPMRESAENVESESDQQGQEDRQVASMQEKQHEEHEEEQREEQEQEEDEECSESSYSSEASDAPAVSPYRAGVYDAVMEEQHQYGLDGVILSSRDLGVESRRKYERLMQIVMDGEDITPEDYELLLQLDANNQKNTIKESQIETYETLLIGAKNEPGKIGRESLANSSCLVCMELFDKMGDGVELRRLPCEHLFCKKCVDRWLKENSAKCPNLSCFWGRAE